MRIPHPSASFVFSFAVALVVLSAAPHSLASLTLVSLPPIYIPPQASLVQQPTVPATPVQETALATHIAAAAPVKPATGMAEPGYPEQLSIPSVGIVSPIQAVGITANGEMAVPSGKSNNVGWWTGGASPGQNGTAVLDAHVFAAFKKLDQVKVGDSLYVETANGTQLHFVVVAARTYALSAITSQMLFGEGGTPRLNLITCAGTLTKDHSTYDHRLVVYTKLVS